MKKNKFIKGRWYKINKKIKKRITAKYHKIKDWAMDPKGYFLIAIVAFTFIGTVILFFLNYLYY